MINRAHLALLLAPLLSSLLTSAPAHALQFKQTVDADQVTATISAREISRIGLAQDRIRMVNGDADVDITHDDASGDVYVKAKQPPLAKPLNLFVATEKGFTYQLLLIPEDVPSEQIIIRNADAVDGNGEAQAWEAQSPVHAATIALIKATAGIVPSPAGYVRKSIKAEPERKGNLSIQKTFTLTGTALEGMALSVRNTGVETTTLMERDLFAPGQTAVWLPVRTLQPDQSVRAYVVRKRIGGRP